MLENEKVTAEKQGEIPGFQHSAGRKDTEKPGKKYFCWIGQKIQLF